MLKTRHFSCGIIRNNSDEIIRHFVLILIKVYIIELNFRRVLLVLWNHGVPVALDVLLIVSIVLLIKLQQW